MLYAIKQQESTYKLHAEEVNAKLERMRTDIVTATNDLHKLLDANAELSQQKIAVLQQLQTSEQAAQVGCLLLNCCTLDTFNAVEIQTCWY